MGTSKQDGLAKENHVSPSHESSLKIGIQAQNGSAGSGLVLWSCQNPWSRVYIPLPTTGFVSLKQRELPNTGNNYLGLATNPPHLIRRWRYQCVVCISEMPPNYILYPLFSENQKTGNQCSPKEKKKERTDQKSAVLCQFFHNSSYNLMHLLETFYYTTEAETFYYTMK